MNKSVTSKEAILEVSKGFLAKTGISDLNIRSVANKCNVSIGSVYNYFPSKEALVLETVANVWSEIFHNAMECGHPEGFLECITWIEERIKEGVKKYPSFMMVHATLFAGENKESGRKMMNQYQEHIKKGLLQILREDKRVREDAFSDEFTAENLVDFIFLNILAALQRENGTTKLLQELIKRSIYVTVSDTRQ